MLCNMESAAADTFEALLRASPPLPRPVPIPREIILDRMERAITALLLQGECVTRVDMKRQAFTDAEIEQLFETACRHSIMEVHQIEMNGIRRARVPAGRAQNP